MAVLSTQNRQRIARALMRYWSNLFETVTGITKADLAAAVNATDDWIDTNQSSYNNALPPAAKTNLTADQKTLLFCAIALTRVSVPLLRRVFGEVD